MQRICDPEKCFGCGACSLRCISGAVTMRTDPEGFSAPVIDKAKCAECGQCLTVCPALHPLPAAENNCYALRTYDPDLLYKSTSGGAFSVIASYVLERGGLVCGAVFDDHFRVKHILSDDISPMRKSKYAQSDLCGCLKDLESALASGTGVLFSGTPCQCHAVKRLFPDAEGLLTAALICRGAASPLFWEEYLRLLGGDGPLTAFCFRDKRLDNDAHTVAYTCSGTEHTSDFMRDPFCRIYAKELPFRQSCYTCPYTTALRAFDFSIGDFWGVENIFPDLADRRGVSLVLTGSEKADRILRSLSGRADIRKTDPASALQPALTSPAKQTLLRKFFFKDLTAKGPDGHCDMNMLIKKYGF